MKALTLTGKSIIFAAALLGAFAVIFGAFGAHALETKISIDQLNSYKTGNTYQFYHSLLLLVLGILYSSKPKRILLWASWLCIIGIFCFSGSIYLLACKDLLGISYTGILGPITPIGGLLFIISWLLLAIYALKNDQ